SRVLQLHRDGYEVILTGDFNAHIQNPKNNTEFMDDCGSMLLEMCKSCDMVINNHLDHCVGQYTRIPKNDNQMATLDYIITSKNINPHTFHVDEDRQILDSSDHVCIVARFNLDLERNNSISKLNSRWNINESTDWEKYKDHIKTLCDLTINPIRLNNDLLSEPQTDYERLIKIITTAAIDTVGKTKSTNKGPKKENKRIQALRTQRKTMRIELRKAKENEEPQKYIDLINSRILNQKFLIQ
ncbi:MAG: hypothetical protein GY795_20745, partial [Desulfobacterales bacterium]|nr:hypothetical protein [Desulfobacterales bacterium]